MNLGQLQTAIQDHGYGSDTAAQQTDFLNAEYRRICGRRRWPFLEGRDTSLSTTTGVPNVSLATLNGGNWRNLDSVRISVPASQDYPEIEYMQPEEFFDLQQTNPLELATPRVWTFHEQQLYFYPTPDQVYQLSINYIKEITPLSAPTDVLVIPVEYHDILVAGAIKRIAFRNRDWIGLELWTAEYKEMFDALDEEYRIKQRQTSSQVKRSGWWDTVVTYPFTSTGF